MLSSFNDFNSSLAFSFSISASYLSSRILSIRFEIIFVAGIESGFMTKDVISAVHIAVLTAMSICFLSFLDKLFGFNLKYFLIPPACVYFV